MAIHTIDVTPASLNVVVASGDMIRLRFEEIRTTGFQWRLVSDLPSNVVVIREDYVMQGGGIGGGGIHEFVFEVQSGSTAVLLFRHVRIWNPQATREATVSISVR